MRSVLLLNADCTPLNIISVPRAISLLNKDKTYVHPDSKVYKIRSINQEIEVPRAIIMKYYIKTPRRKFFPTRKNILARDNFECMYCGIEVSGKQATIDHVKPRKQGGGNSWTNLVCACVDCNRYKGNRTPAEAGMTLRRKPSEPTVHVLYHTWEEIFLLKAS